MDLANYYLTKAQQQQAKAAKLQTAEAAARAAAAATVDYLATMAAEQLEHYVEDAYSSGGSGAVQP